MYKVTPEAFRARLYEAAKIDHKSLRKWLTETGIGVGTAQTILPADLNGRNSIPSAEKLVEISAVTGRSIDWLLGIDDDRRKLQQSLVRDADGGRMKDLAYVFDALSQEAAPGIALPRVWLKDRLGRPEKDLAVMSVPGDTMAPTLVDGDLALVAAAPAVADGLHVIDFDGLLIIRRVQMDEAGRVRFLADNPQYKPFEAFVDSSRRQFMKLATTEDEARFEQEMSNPLTGNAVAPSRLGKLVGRVVGVLSLAR